MHFLNVSPVLWIKIAKNAMKHHFKKKDIVDTDIVELIGIPYRNMK